jgi:hypothetical protein
VGKAISKDPEVTARYQHIQTAQKALKNMLEDFFDQLGNAIRYPQDENAAPMMPVAITAKDPLSILKLYLKHRSWR